MYQEDDLTFLRTLFANCTWHVAKTMPNIPHSYTRGREWGSWEHFRWAVYFIREHGIDERFYSRIYRYFYLDGYKHWTMDENPNDVILINRAAA